MCPTGDGVEDTEHCLLQCPYLSEEGRDLLPGVFLRPKGYINPSNEVLTEILLNGDKDFCNDVNREILQLTLQYIHKTGRFG